MSWNDYVSNLVATGHIEKAAIVGFQGSVWAITSGWNIAASEITALASGWPNFSAAGVKIGGTKFMFIRGDDTSVIGKDKATGIVIGKTKQAFVIGYHNDKQQSGNANKEILKITDYLSEQGY